MNILSFTGYSTRALTQMEIAYAKLPTSFYIAAYVLFVTQGFRGQCSFKHLTFN